MTTLPLTKPSGFPLRRYETARQALAEARRVDEVKDIRDKAEALEAYAKQAKDLQLLRHAREIKLRAEYKAGELLKDLKVNGELREGRPKKLCDEGIVFTSLAKLGIDEHQSADWQKLSAITPENFLDAMNEALDRGDHVGALTVIEIAKHGVHFSSETPEHYTPKIALDAIISCLGEIDLDPCGNPGDPNVPAHRHHTEADDGLTQDWHGRVFMNPPYGREIGAWVRKLHSEYRETRRVTEAIALVPSRTDTEWFRVLRDYPVCFISGRLTFVGNSDPAPFPSAVFYLGDNLRSFTSSFRGLGDVWTRVR